MSKKRKLRVILNLRTKKVEKKAFIIMLNVRKSVSNKCKKKCK